MLCMVFFPGNIRILDNACYCTSVDWIFKEITFIEDEVLYKLGFVEKLTKEKKIEALGEPMHLGIKCCANQNSKCALQILIVH